MAWGGGGFAEVACFGGVRPSTILESRWTLAMMGVADDFGYGCLDKGKRESVNVVDDSKHNAETSHTQRPKQ